MSEQPTENVIPPSSLPTPPELDFEAPAPPMPPEASQPPMPPAAPPMPPVAPPIAFTPPAPEAPPAPPEPIISAAPQPTTTPIPEQPKPMPVGATQLQLPVARLLHERSNSNLDLPTNLNLVHIGKPNDRIPPDIDVSGFPDSDVVSRVHADIRVEPDGYYIEDTGSANGTYVNNQPLRPGDRYRLRAGDRISLGKEDKVGFIFHPG
ncbi:FHA domain-containing protein [Acaryochloris sp. 'Moss Beach']|uniref:FHA domain-containing protein n=1 Tax=Acaryochloris sp. 'Moss Beach' TaxID=2740837 RepID=UPI002714D16D|nr:FHA domain-containing protein [Acaryochloris sp. 'Moss Beach']